MRDRGGYSQDDMDRGWDARKDKNGPQTSQPSCFLSSPSLCPYTEGWVHKVEQHQPPGRLESRDFSGHLGGSAGTLCFKLQTGLAVGFISGIAFFGITALNFSLLLVRKAESEGEILQKIKEICLI